MITIKRNKPFSFKLFATTWSIVWENKRMNDKTQFGESDYSQNKITLSTSDGIKELTDDRIKDTFYHEKVHAILDTMHEYEKSKDEKFVDQFAKLLRQSDETLTLK
jgi:hypothetical protein